MNLIKASIRLHNSTNSVDFDEAEREFLEIFKAFRAEIPDGSVSVTSEKECYFAKNMQNCKDGTLLHSEVFIVTFRHIELLKVEEITNAFLAKLRIPEIFLLLYSMEAKNYQLNSVMHFFRKPPAYWWLFSCTPHTL